MKKTEDLAGKRFGKWEVLRRDTDCECNAYNAYWFCRCECGSEKPVNGSHLRRGKSISCRRCSEHKHKGRLTSRIWHRVVYNAKKRMLLMDLGEVSEAKVFLYDLLYNQQKCRCALTGLPIGIANTIDGDRHGETTASIDRINSAKGYTRDNVQWVHKWINLMKSDLSEDEFITFCEAVVRYKRGF